MVNDEDDLDSWLAGSGGTTGAAGAPEAGVDDVWGEDSDDDDSGGSDLLSDEPSHPQRATLAVRQEKALRAKHYKEGFKEAVGQAREDALQHGFGDGFKEAFALGLRTGRVVGLCTTLQGLVKEEATVAELKQLSQDCKGFAKRPIDMATLERLEARMKDISL